MQLQKAYIVLTEFLAGLQDNPAFTLWASVMRQPLLAFVLLALFGSLSVQADDAGLLAVADTMPEETASESGVAAPATDDNDARGVMDDVAKLLGEH